MKNKFASRIATLRKQNGWSQKTASQRLGISQALLSHYEKGIRECGLDFVIKAAEIYSVPCDYLLGVIDKVPQASRLPVETIEHDEIDENPKLLIGRNQMLSALNLLYSIAARLDKPAIHSDLNLLLYSYTYRVLRVLESCLGENKSDVFSLPFDLSIVHASSLQGVAIERLLNKLGDDPIPRDFSTKRLKAEYKDYAKSVLNIVETVENTSVRTII